MAKIARIVGAFAVGALLLLAAAGWFFSGLIIHPPWVKSSLAANGLKIEAFREASAGEPFTVTTEDGVVLRGFHIRHRPGNDRAVVLVHGYGYNLTEYEKKHRPWAELGYDVFVYDHRYCGLSGGDFTSCSVRESADLGRVTAYARTRLAPKAQLGVAGTSMGGATVLLYAGSGGPCDFVVAECPFSSFTEQLRVELERDYKVVPTFLRPVLIASAVAAVRLRTGVDLREAEPIRRVAQITVPVCYLNTASDSKVPPAMTLELYAATTAKKRLRVFPGGDHATAYADHPQEYAAELKAFLTENHLR